MELSGEVELDGASSADAWTVFSDPAAIRDAVPGCEFIRPVGDVEDVDAFEPEAEAATASGARTGGDGRTFAAGDEYVAVIQVGTGDIEPRFESTIRITEREFPRMSARVDGAGGDSAFGMDTEIELVETPTGVAVDWTSDAEVSGRLAQMNASLVALVSEKLVDRFFERIGRSVQAVRE